MPPSKNDRDKPGEDLRVRFAPSPTGYLHIGGARTALFNYLYARRHGGVFVLRVEDTDRGRSTPEAVGAILDGMRYLELDWDEGPETGGPFGPYVQSERAALHRDYVDRLLERGAAYHCFCSKERLGRLRGEQKARKERFLYDRRCLSIEAQEASDRLRAGEPAVVRFKIPEGKTVIRDLVRGEIVFDHREIEDFVIRRTDGTTVYNLAVMADDHAMGITCVIRGEDHLSNTPKQALLFDALELARPAYAHIPLILGPGGAKLSKRHGAVSVTEYREKGYLPEAMINFLVRMGWSYDDRQEIFSREELIEKFSLDGISRSGAVYDIKKLEHLGGHYLRERPFEYVLKRAIPYLVKRGYVCESDVAPEGPQRAKVAKIVELEQQRADCLERIAENAGYYFEDPVALDPGGAKAVRKKQDSLPAVKRYARALDEDFPDGWGPLDDRRLEEHATRFIEAEGLKLGDLAQPVRALLTGRSATPGLFEVLAIVGRDACLRRLARAEEWFEQVRQG